MDKDLEHLKLLGIFHYIWGALACLAGLIGVVYLIIGVAVRCRLRIHQTIVLPRSQEALFSSG
jgi:hypothetical protein